MLTADMKEDLLGKATALKVIPTVSNVVDRVLSIIADSESSFNDLTDVIKYDQAISSKIISIANSAYYSRGVQVFSLQRAIITIGFEEVKKIVMCLVFMNDLLKQLKLKPRDLMDLWKHSALVACAARVLSKKMLVEDPQKVFTVALLHDIGKTVLYMSVENYYAMVEEARSKGKALEVMEKDRFGVDHQEIGYAIGVKWRFPEEFLYAIRYHHDGKNGGNHGSVVRLVRAADAFSVASNKDIGPEGYILLNEKDGIMREMQKIVDFLHIE